MSRYDDLRRALATIVANAKAGRTPYDAGVKLCEGVLATDDQWPGHGVAAQPAPDEHLEREYDEGSDIDNWEAEQVFQDREGV